MSTRFPHPVAVSSARLMVRGQRGSGVLLAAITLLAACGGTGGGSTDDVGTELGGSDACSVDCVDTTDDATSPDATAPDATEPDTIDQETAPHDTDPTPDDVAVDTDVAPLDTDDAEMTPDADDVDAASPDGTGDDVPDADPPGDTTPGDTCATEPFIDLDFAYVRCAESFTGLRRWVPTTDGSTCPAYFTLLGDRYDTAEEALTAKACDTDCTWAPSTSFTVLRCGRRTGYILYRAADSETCGDLYEFPEGLYPTVEAHDQAHPCPPE